MHYEQLRRSRPKCQEPGCPTKADKLGYCRRHERRALERLDEGHEGSPVMDAELEQIAESIHVNPVTGCWEWTGSENRKYAAIVVGGREWLGHRLMYVWFIGGHAPNKELEHICANPPCIRPNHLQPVSRRINLAREVRRARHKEAAFWTDDYLCTTTIPLLLWAGKHGLPAVPSYWRTNGDTRAAG